MGFELTGAEELIKQLERMGMRVESVGDAALTAAAQPIAEEAKSRVHPISGDLTEAIRAGKPRTGRNGRKITIGVHRKDWHKDDYYPAYVEFGHGGPRPAPPHPYIRPALETKRDEANAIIVNTIKAALPH